MDFILRKLAQTIGEATRLGIPIVGATEHTTQTPPTDLCQIIRVSVEHGAYRLIIADTISITRPHGVARIVRFVRQVLQEMRASVSDGAHHLLCH